jgi:hypothetical protein
MYDDEWHIEKNDQGRWVAVWKPRNEVYRSAYVTETELVIVEDVGLSIPLSTLRELLRRNGVHR